MVDARGDATADPTADLRPDFRALFEESPDVLLVLLPDAPRFTMIAATRARLAATHTTREQVIGRGLFELFPDNPDDPAATGARNLRASLDRVMATRAADTMAVQKYDIRGTDGAFQVKYWSPKNIPVLSPSGSVLYILHRVEDVTDLVQASELGNELRDRTQAMEREVIQRSRELAEANRSLREANAKLGELDVAKTTFFSNISHEFRTPLTLMLGPLEDALADAVEPLGARQKERIGLAYGNALRLLKLVNTLLDFSRIEAGRLRAHYAPTDIGPVTAELAGMFQSAVDKAGIRLVIECPPLREPVWVDRDMWEKIVPNLISNAFKFTKAGAITVRVIERPAGIQLEVLDTGVGIPESELPRIFDRFYRVAGAAGRTHEGSGIGLSLVRELVEMHGGHITVESQVGRGTTFRVEMPRGFSHLPAEAVSQKAAEWAPGRDAAAHASEAVRWAGASESTPPRRRGEAEKAGPSASSAEHEKRAEVLVVDDNADLRRYIVELLSAAYDVRTAENGRVALDKLRERTPDIVVSDVMMPELDGFGLVHALRDDPKTASIPVILLSARAGEEPSVAGLDAGADDYLVKPFAARELLARVRTHVDLARARRAWIAELERANRELDAFSYSVSHDLRAPLRAIDGFSRMLVEDYGQVVGDRGRHYIDRICDGVRKMTALIDDMLKLAHIARAPVSVDTVDLSALAASAVVDLQRADPGRSVTIAIAQGVRVKADRALMGIVLVNLIGNAWKYTSKTPNARIEFGQDPAAGDPTFYVRDDGAGFDMQYAGRLFAPFQRFHDAAEFEGTGVGLATVQRVIARHGGRIWAEAAVGQGATFFFSLPARPTVPLESSRPPRRITSRPRDPR